MAVHETKDKKLIELATKIHIIGDEMKSLIEKMSDCEEKISELKDEFWPLVKKLIPATDDDNNYRLELSEDAEKLYILEDKDKKSGVIEEFLKKKILRDIMK